MIIALIIIAILLGTVIYLHYTNHKLKKELKDANFLAGVSSELLLLLAEITQKPDSKPKVEERPVIPYHLLDEE